MNNLLHIWIKKIRTNDPYQVVELYRDEGMLLGTFSDKERHGKKSILDYFENLLKSKVDVELITQNEYKTDSIIVNSGFYNFVVDNKVIEARFSFVFTKKADCWKILSHHSSIVPRSN